MNKSLQSFGAMDVSQNNCREKSTLKNYKSMTLDNTSRDDQIETFVTNLFLFKFATTVGEERVSKVQALHHKY